MDFINQICFALSLKNNEHYWDLLHLGPARAYECSAA